jgi:hypothetical protein
LNSLSFESSPEQERAIRNVSIESSLTVQKLIAANGRMHMALPVEERKLSEERTTCATYTENSAVTGCCLKTNLQITQHPAMIT